MAVQDAGGNMVTTSTASVTLTITTPAGATLTCSANPKNAVAGVDAFSGYSINTSGTYALTAASTGLTSAVSNSFNRADDERHLGALATAFTIPAGG